MRRIFLHVPKIDQDGRIVLLSAAVITVLLTALWSPLLLLGVVVTVMAYVGFRDPDRRTFDLDAAVISPVDGFVLEIDGMDPPAELRLPPGDYNRLRISSSPFSVSTWRAPVAGKISALYKKKGRIWNLALEPDDEDNNAFFFSVANSNLACGSVLLSGGLVPRFILDVEPDAMVVAGARIGQRLYGGWCDVYVPVNAVMQVAVGQTLVAGETIVARIGAPTPPATHLR